MHPEDPDIENRFTYHPPGPIAIERHKEVRDTCKALAYLVSGLPNGREKSLALTHVEEVAMWANASIARNGEDIEQ